MIYRGVKNKREVTFVSLSLILYIIYNSLKMHYIKMCELQVILGVSADITGKKNS
jgi:hypothetical protein